MAEKYIAEFIESGWLAPSVVMSALYIIIIIIASVVIPLLLHWLRGRREHKAYVFKMRTEIYTRYLRKYEQAAEGVGNDYKEFSQVTLKNEFRKLLEAGDSPDAIVAFQEVVSEFPQKIIRSHQQATEENTNIKILGSRKLLELTRQFEYLNKEILEMSSDWLSEMKETLSSPDPETPIAEKMNEKGKEAKKLKEQIIEQMRRELGVRD